MVGFSIAMVHSHDSLFRRCSKFFCPTVLLAIQQGMMKGGAFSGEWTSQRLKPGDRTADGTHFSFSGTWWSRKRDDRSRGSRCGNNRSEGDDPDPRPDFDRATIAQL